MVVNNIFISVQCCAFAIHRFIIFNPVCQIIRKANFIRRNNSSLDFIKLKKFYSSQCLVLRFLSFPFLFSFSVNYTVIEPNIICLSLLIVVNIIINFLPAGFLFARHKNTSLWNNKLQYTSLIYLLYHKERFKSR